MIKIIAPPGNKGSDPKKKIGEKNTEPENENGAANTDKQESTIEHEQILNEQAQEQALNSSDRSEEGGREEFFD